jgi:hypothetical protein
MWKTHENPWFSQENCLHMVDFQHLYVSLPKGKSLFWRKSPLFAHESHQLRILMRIQDWVKLAVVRARATDTCLDRRLMRASLMGYYRAISS